MLWLTLASSVVLTFASCDVGTPLAELTPSCVLDAPCTEWNEDPSEAGKVDTNKLQELSGIAGSRLNTGVFWVHNDGTMGATGAVANREGIPRVYGVLRDGSVVAKLDLEGLPLTRKTDIEDIAVGYDPDTGGTAIYLADTGDNDENRRKVRIIKIPEPRIDVDDPDERDAEFTVYEFRYEGNKQYDVEAVAILPNGQILLVSKDQVGSNHGKAKMFMLTDPDASSTNRAVRVADIISAPKRSGNGYHQGEAAQVTAADISVDGRVLVLRTRKYMTWYDITDGVPDSSYILEGERIKVRDDDSIDLPQPEAVALDPVDGSLWLTTEIDEGHAKPKLYRLECTGSTLF